MSLPAGAVAFGFLAGMLSTLSPCVLPILPLVLGPAMATHRLGLLAIAAGLVVSFVAIGLFVATIGFSIGVDGDVFRFVSALLLAGLGVLLLSDALQQRFAITAGGLSNAGNRLLARISPDGISGQFLLGLLLGAVWTPCTGPTLGAASVLASQRHDFGDVIAVMVAFGLGTAVPLLLIGRLLSRQAMVRWRGRLLHAGKFGKAILGGAALVVSILILSGLDRRAETALVAASPAWLTDLTTRY
jgi:cytochrome c biogenesis protein CcdA